MGFSRPPQMLSHQVCSILDGSFCSAPQEQRSWCGKLWATSAIAKPGESYLPSEKRMSVPPVVGKGAIRYLQWFD